MSAGLIQRLDPREKRNGSKTKRTQTEECDPIMLRRLIVRLRITQRLLVLATLYTSLHLAGNMAESIMADELLSAEFPSSEGKV